MNILQIVNIISDNPGNLLSGISRLEEKLENGGVCIYLFPEYAKNINLVMDMQKEGKTVYVKTGNALRDYSLLSKICDIHHIDIIHLHFWSIPDCLAIKGALRVRKNIKSVIHHHSRYHVSEKKSNEKIKQWIFKGNYHIACGKGVYQELLGAGFDKDKVFHVDNGIDFSRLDYKENMNWEANSILMFASCGWKIKGVDIACKAINELVQIGKKISLYIAVSGNQKEYEECVRDILGNMPGWIHFLPFRKDVASYYSSAKVFLSASRSEGFCFSVPEAIYCGCETIQSRIPEHRLDIPQCKVFKSGSVEELRQMLLELLQQDRESTERIHRIQKEYVIEKYGLEYWVKGIMQVYQSIY